MSLARTLLATFSVLAATTIVIGSSVGLAYVKKLRSDIPDHMALASWKPSEGSSIFARDGSLIATHAIEDRKYVPIEGLPPHVINAFVAAEDRRYWEHSGVDPKGIFRAAAANLSKAGDERLEGGSTITQQVVKNVLLTPERTVERKVKESILALRADRDIGKIRILDIYLNEIYFGEGAYGIESASKTYFGKTVSELTLAEAALLAGLPKAPSAANPFENPARAAERREYVLRRMVEDGYISSSEREIASREPLPVAARESRRSIDPAMWYAQEEARRIVLGEYGAEALYSRGIEIRTTIDPVLQRVAHQELRAALVREDRKSGWRGPLEKGVPIPVDWKTLKRPDGAEDWLVGVVLSAAIDAEVVTDSGNVTIKGSDLGWATSRKRADAILAPGDAVLVGDIGAGPELVQIPAGIQGAVVAMNPVNGEILALDGGFSHQLSEFNRATQAKRQTGSVFKPFVYLAALELGYDAMSPLLDSPITLRQGGSEPDWTPQGGHGGMGLITLRRSLELSRNMSTVRLLYDIGMEPVVDVARRVGFDLVSSANYSMALGAVEASPVTVAAAYATLANGGHRVEPHLIKGRGSHAESLFDPVTAAQINSILEGVVTSGTARSAFSQFSGTVAGKTGTTNGSRDSWFAAYGPAFVVVGWLGRDDNLPLSDASGGRSAAPMVRKILDKSAGRLKFLPFQLPDGARTLVVDRNTGMPDPDGDIVEIIREGPQ